MKLTKLVAIGVSAIALSAGSALAQTNSITLLQTGTGNGQQVSQAGGTDERLYIEQVGDNNTGNATQTGNGDDTFVDQQGNGNTATQTISGTNQQSDIFQGVTTSFGGPLNVNDNTASVTQSGVDNWSYVGQFASGNSATVTMSGDGNRVGTAGGFGGFGNTANVDLEQYTDDNTATVDQAGFNQGVSLYQGVAVVGSPAGAPILTGTLFNSIGTNNSASVTQGAGADNAAVGVYQGASDNRAFVEQQGVNQFIEIRQDGADPTTPLPADGNNGADVLQSGLATGATAFVLQNGISNDIVLTQNSIGAIADLQQYGNQNMMNITQ